MLNVKVKKGTRQLSNKVYHNLVVFFYLCLELRKKKHSVQPNSASKCPAGSTPTVLPHPDSESLN